MNTIPILYEDNHLLVVVKPPDLLSQGDRTGDRDLLTIMKQYIRETYQKPGNVYLGLVHRLDRPVGGVMVFGKTSKGAARLSKQIRDGEFRRRYLAVVEGYLEPLAGNLRGYLIKDGKKNLVRVARANERGAQEAILDYRVVDLSQGRSLVRIWLLPSNSGADVGNWSSPLWGQALWRKDSSKAPGADCPVGRVHFLYASDYQGAIGVCPRPARG